jgi:hypothetical protein
LLDVISGKVSADVVAARWQAALEENAQLEAAREAALQAAEDIKNVRASEQCSR